MNQNIIKIALFVSLLCLFMVLCVCIVSNYRGIQYEIENDTWWGAAAQLREDWTLLVHPWYEGEAVPNVEDRCGRPYYDDPWRYMDNNGNVHFCYSRIVVLAVWYVYVFLGPPILLFFFIRWLYRKFYRVKETEI